MSHRLRHILMTNRLPGILIVPPSKRDVGKYLNSRKTKEELTYLYHLLNYHSEKFPRTVESLNKVKKKLKKEIKDKKKFSEITEDEDEHDNVILEFVRNRGVAKKVREELLGTYVTDIPFTKREKGRFLKSVKSSNMDIKNPKYFVKTPPTPKKEPSPKSPTPLILEEMKAESPTPLNLEEMKLESPTPKSLSPSTPKSPTLLKLEEMDPESPIIGYRVQDNENVKYRGQTEDFRQPLIQNKQENENVVYQEQTEDFRQPLIQNKQDNEIDFGGIKIIMVIVITTFPLTIIGIIIYVIYKKKKNGNKKNKTSP